MRDFVTYAKIHFNSSIKSIRSDNAPEFKLDQFYSQQGILHQTSCRETLQQNGRVECKHQHILNVARAFLFQSNLPKKIWSYVITHASVFLGFKIGMKGYIFYDLTTKEINVTRNAIFSELTFPYQSQPQINSSVSPPGPIHEDPYSLLLLSHH